MSTNKNSKEYYRFLNNGSLRKASIKAALDDLRKEVEEVDEAEQENNTPGLKLDDDKPRYDLLPSFALEEVANVLTFGANKYGADNWRDVESPNRRYIAAAMRHIEAYRKGDNIDLESGLCHLSHAITSLMFVQEFYFEELKHV